MADENLEKNVKNQNGRHLRYTPLLAVEISYQSKLVAKCSVTSQVYVMAKDRRFEGWVWSEERFLFN